MGIFDRPTTGPALSSNFAGTIAGAAGGACEPVEPIAVPALQPLPAYAAAKPAVAASPTTSASDRSYINFAGFPFPLGPFTSRATVQTELASNRVLVRADARPGGDHANQRSVVFRMRDNHLLVYNPVAPTKELRSSTACSRRRRPHPAGRDAVRAQGLRRAFARRFRRPRWAVPDQWSFPLDLPSPLLGIDEKGSGGGELTDTLPATSSLCTTYSGLCNAAYARAPDLTAEFEVKLLRPKSASASGTRRTRRRSTTRTRRYLRSPTPWSTCCSAPPPVFVTDGGDNLRGIGDDAALELARPPHPAGGERRQLARQRGRGGRGAVERDRCRRRRKGRRRGAAAARLGARRAALALLRRRPRRSSTRRRRSRCLPTSGASRR